MTHDSRARGAPLAADLDLGASGQASLALAFWHSGHQTSAETGLGEVMQFGEVMRDKPTLWEISGYRTDHRLFFRAMLELPSHENPGHLIGQAMAHIAKATDPTCITEWKLIRVADEELESKS